MSQNQPDKRRENNRHYGFSGLASAGHLTGQEGVVNAVP